MNVPDVSTDEHWENCAITELSGTSDRANRSGDTEDRYHGETRTINKLAGSPATARPGSFEPGFRVARRVLPCPPRRRNIETAATVSYFTSASD